MKKLFYICFVFVFAFQWCSDSGTNSKKEKYSGIIENVDFDELFSEPIQADIDQIYHEWNSRDLSVVNHEEVDSFSILMPSYKLATLRIISHEISPGQKHYGAIIIPKDTTDQIYPVVVYNHGGEDGVNISDLALMMSMSNTMKQLVDKTIMVIPSFRTETLIFNDGVNEHTYHSGGEASIWDKDVDDSIILLSAVLASTPEVDPSKIVTFGISRGGAVSMLMSARDDRIKKVVDFFGPTDMFDDWIKDLMERTLKGEIIGVKPVVTSNNCTNCGRCIDVCDEDVFKFGLR